MTRTNITKQLSYRIPMPVTHIVVYQNNHSFPVCPKCNITFEIEYQSYCGRCGQCLKWDEYENAEIIKKPF